MNNYKKLVDEYIVATGATLCKQELIDFLEAKDFQIMRISEGKYAREDVLQELTNNDNEGNISWLDSYSDAEILNAIEDNQSESYWDCYWSAVDGAIRDLKEANNE